MASKTIPTRAADDGFMTVKDAAAYLCLSVQAVYNLISSGELPSARFGGARRIAWAALREYTERCTTGGTASTDRTATE